MNRTPLMSERRTAMLGGALVAIGPISMALYTPAMPVLAAAFDTSQAMIKLTLTAYFTGFALSQLLCGPLTDAFGRKPIALLFLSLYLASTLLATYAPTIEWMLAARALQGVGASVGIAVSRALARDQFVGQASARIMNTTGMMLAIGPALAPTIGGVTLELFGWREIFIAMIIYGVALMLGVMVFMRETNPYIDRSNLHPYRLFRNYLTLITDTRFLQPSLLTGIGTGTIYTMATILPFVLIDKVGLTPVEFGFGMMVQSCSFIAGTIVTARLLRRVEAHRLLPYGIAGIVVAAVSMVVLLTMFPLHFLTVMGPVGLFVFFLATVMPSAFTSALHDFPKIAGAASAMMGFLQFGAGLAGSLVAAALGDPLLGVVIVPPGMMLLAVGLYQVLGMRNRRRAIAAE
ncbi:multidrug effflux MFS transporter [Stappia indica]|uniref:multidrug effflux MFS transporter n=1 Tax=Stappia indica TaxID=538381 RepID=UPI001CD3462D|nr:multidrug effflux MFS transporter [Stappia indica]MCA1300219.1 multidrug effflux MFS transporter [Stappia indica]